MQISGRIAIGCLVQNEAFIVLPVVRAIAPVKLNLRHSRGPMLYIHHLRSSISSIYTEYRENISLDLDSPDYPHHGSWLLGTALASENYIKSKPIRHNRNGHRRGEKAWLVKPYIWILALGVFTIALFLAVRRVKAVDNIYHRLFMPPLPWGCWITWDSAS